ncbi:MAG: hypothetical protein GX096_07960 [Clostridiales bacterium]|nr:hypothetical protein [Clostridiales bacterium]
MANAVERMFNSYMRIKKEVERLDRETYQYMPVTDVVTGSMTEFPYLMRKYTIRDTVPVLVLNDNTNLEKRLKVLSSRRTAVANHLNTITDSNIVELLRLRYVFGYGWSLVAMVNHGGYSEDEAKAIIAQYFKGFD